MNDEDNYNDEDIDKVEAEVVPTSRRSRVGGRRTSGGGGSTTPHPAADEGVGEGGATDDDNGNNKDGPGSRGREDDSN